MTSSFSCLNSFSACMIFFFCSAYRSFSSLLLSGSSSCACIPSWCISFLSFECLTQEMTSWSLLNTVASSVSPGIFPSLHCTYRLYLFPHHSLQCDESLQGPIWVFLPYFHPYTFLKFNKSWPIVASRHLTLKFCPLIFPQNTPEHKAA